MLHPVLAQLQSRDATQRAAACRAAEQDPSAVLLVDALIQALNDSNTAVCRAAARSLSALQQSVPEVARHLRAALRSDATRLRVFAASALLEIEPPSPALLPALVAGLADGDGHVRWSAAHMLVEAGRLLPEVEPLLRGLAQSDTAPDTRGMACACLAELAPDSPRTAASVLHLLGEESARLRRAGLTAAARLHHPSAALRARLQELAENDQAAICRRLAAAILTALSEHPAGDASVPRIIHEAP